MIDDLAALHGLTADLTVSPTSRIAGAIQQVITASGAATVVARQ
jgi:hypothetical protein